MKVRPRQHNHKPKEAHHHLRIPLGDNPNAKSSSMLEGDTDTMCGICTGNLTYHRSIANKFPCLVEQFPPLAKLMDQNPTGIGGIGADEGGQPRTGTEITHIISHRMLF
eukprot:3652722-Ditylum_brightwellii.AAC.1